MLLLAGEHSAAEPAADPDLRILFGHNGWSWVDDTSRLRGRLRFAGSWGYNAFIYAVNAPARLDGRGDTNWIRDASTGGGWKLAEGGRPGHADARGGLIARLKAIQAATEAEGMEYIPAWGPWGWGNTVRDIDPATAAGAYYDMAKPAASEEGFRLEDGGGIIASFDQWGEAGRAGGKADIRFGHDGRLAKAEIKVRGPGFHAAQFTLKPRRDGYWRLELEAENRGGADSAMAKVYSFHGAENHPLSTRQVARAARPLPSGTTALSTAFFAAAGETLLLDVEVHSRSRSGGALRIRSARLRPGLPPRELMVEAAAPPMDTASGAAWDSLAGARGHFPDQDCDAFRRSVDPVHPATRRIFLEVAQAVATASGRKPRRYLLGADEVFCWRSRGLSRPPYAGMDRGTLYATLLLERMRAVDSVYASLYPRDTTTIAYIVWGDMLSSLNGLGRGTLGALRSLAAARLPPGKLLVAPWYYDSEIAGSSVIYGKRGIPASLPDLEKFRLLLRRDLREISGAGLDILGTYSTYGPHVGASEEIGGAEAWAGVCGEHAGLTAPERARARERKGACRGFIYAGWDTETAREWGNEYNGLLSLAWFGWASRGKPGGPGDLFADEDKDGILDALEARRPGPFSPSPPGRRSPSPAPSSPR